MANYIIVIVLLLIIGAAALYVIKAKKKGVKCIGCPAAGNCPSKTGSNTECICGCQTDTKEG